MTAKKGDKTMDESPARRGFIRRHRLLVAVLSLPLVLVLAAAGWVWYLDSQISDIPRFDADLDRPGRPAPAQSGAANILLVGVDNGRERRIQDALAADEWPAGSFRSDTMMVLHLEADQDGAQLISMPRDSWVPVPGYGTTKLNHAFSYGGPGLLVQAIEDLTRVRIDHVAIVDWDGFDGLIDVIGGVDIEGQNGTAERLTGSGALDYVRERKTLPRGDFSRIQRQQNVLRSTVREILELGVLGNPVKLTNLIEESKEFLSVDDSLTNRRIRGLARSHRNVSAKDTDFLTIPTLGTGTEDGLSVVLVDPEEVRALFAAVARDEYDRWYAEQDTVDELPEPSRVP